MGQSVSKQYQIVPSGSCQKAIGELSGSRRGAIVCWFAGWLAGWLSGWVAGWLGGWVAGWLAG